MKTFITKMIAKAAGLGNVLGPVLRFIQGKKAYSAGAALMLQGVTMLLSDLESANTLGQFIDILKQPDWLASVSQGLGIIGLRNAKAKEAPKVEE